MTKPEIPARAPYVRNCQPGMYAWCACGRSKRQPYCDGAHAGTGIVPRIEHLTAPCQVAWCGCKHSKRPPYCDGTHQQLPS